MTSYPLSNMLDRDCVMQMRCIVSMPTRRHRIFTVATVLFNQYFFEKQPKRHTYSASRFLWKRVLYNSNAFLISDMSALYFRTCFVVMMKTRCILTSFTEIQLLVSCFYSLFAFILIVASVKPCKYTIFILLKKVHGSKFNRAVPI